MDRLWMRVRQAGKNCASIRRASGQTCLFAASDRSQQRFSLLEGLLAIVLTALILVGAAPFFYTGRAMLYRASLKRQAVERATDHIEALLVVNFDQIQDDEQQIQLGDVPATVNTEVESVHIDGDGNGYKQVTVSITWTVGTKNDQVSLLTYISSANGAY